MKHNKNTYVFSINRLVAHRFARGLFDTSHVALVRRNGEHTYEQKNILTDGSVDIAHCVNMIQDYDLLEPVMGIIAATAVEYLDKDTGKPVVILFPASTHFCHGYDATTYNKHLNHTSRHDLAYQMRIREQMIDRATSATR